MKKESPSQLSTQRVSHGLLADVLDLFTLCYSFSTSALARLPLFQSLHRWCATARAVYTSRDQIYLDIMGTLGKEGRASGNWQRLQKVIEKSKADSSSSDHTHKRRKLGHSATTPTSETTNRSLASASILPIASTSSVLLTTDSEPPSREVLDLRTLISSPTPHHPALPERHRLPGQYIAVDCEMVGVGPLGSESSLARVSIVNYHGAVLCDLFVRQKERVTDWRTRWSGIREMDMVGAKPFEEVQTMVSNFMKDRVLIGHAVHNDLQALLLSHPRAQLRDTQVLARKHGQSRVKHPSLKNLVRDMLGVAIQEGEHSSVVDARATMAIFRLHRKEWERPFSVKGVRVPIFEPEPGAEDGEEAGLEDEDDGGAVREQKQKRKRSADAVIEEAASTPDLQLHLASSKTSTVSVSVAKQQQQQPLLAAPSVLRKKKVKSGSAADGCRGISSGLSTVITRRSKGGPQEYPGASGEGQPTGGGAKRKSDGGEGRERLVESVVDADPGIDIMTLGPGTSAGRSSIPLCLLITGTRSRCSLYIPCQRIGIFAFGCAYQQ
ncbi:hypothetical protein EVG20_g5589 [Dentipellis fragilis]|uniref:RNA exonuclease 4 n=1 Tax=Dentipellis fragilis TaxID=205917 RepID=A0A4Y9YSN2_9AGAM|nr:hypothetical protein EVG20_g5589 [Dentipellis fragilis]